MTGSALIVATLETTPPDATHWSTRSMADHLGLSQSMVSRVWRAFGLAPHKQDSWKLSKDPLFVAKVRDVVGLYLDPPERALVLCVTRKPRSRRSTGPSRCSRCCRGPRPGPVTTTFATAPQASTPLLTWPAVRSSDRCTLAIERPSSWRSCARSTPVPADLDVHLVLGQRLYAQDAGGKTLAHRTSAFVGTSPRPARRGEPVERWAELTTSRRPHLTRCG